MTTQTARDQALHLARGDYQVGLVLGHEMIGAAGLQGKAKRFSGSYRRSANTLLARLTAAGIDHHVHYGPRGGIHSATLCFDKHAEERA